LKANESGEMEHTDLAEWQHLHGLHLQFSKPKVAHAGNIERIRCRVNDILLWALALDRRYDVPETVKIIASFKRPWLTLFIEFEDVLVDTKVVNGKRLKLL
jgi:hypothetical protein